MHSSASPDRSHIAQAQKFMLRIGALLGTAASEVRGRMSVRASADSIFRRRD